MSSGNLADVLEPGYTVSIMGVDADGVETQIQTPLVIKGPMPRDWKHAREFAEKHGIAITFIQISPAYLKESYPKLVPHEAPDE